ncbi:MAG: hypothetical protein APF84_09135 [Gracilibacter sp. BRH_c7a]|nr:MAG: hypothetical protein APF84_09135 [Gracilibacter sp. BRH_c7a]
MRKGILVLLCLIILLLSGCVQNEKELPKDVSAISTKWQDNQLVYLTDNGLFVYNTLDGKTEPLMTDDISKRDINWLNCNFSPDKSKYIMITMGKYDNTVEIRDTKTGENFLSLDTEKYRGDVGGYSPPIGQAEWIDNKNIFLTTEFRLYIINILTGREIQVTEECAPVTTKANHNVEAPYLSWAANVKKMGDKLYYNSKREIGKAGLGSIYCGNQEGERELIPNARLIMALDDTRFVYWKETRPDVLATLLYDISTSSSFLIADTDSLPEEIFRINNGKLAYMTGKMTGGIYRGAVYDPNTRQAQEFDIYNAERDFPDNDIDQRQFGHFMGAWEKDGEYVFLFSVENFSTSQGKYLKEYLAYSTRTKKIIEIDDYGDTWLVNMNISPSGEYIAVTKHKSPGDDSFLFDVIQADNLLEQLK